MLTKKEKRKERKTCFNLDPCAIKYYHHPLSVLCDFNTQSLYFVPLIKDNTDTL